MGKLLTILIALGITIAPLPTIAQPSPPLDSGRVLRELNLSDQQLLEIRRLREAHQQRVQPLRDQLRQRQQELQAMLAGSASPTDLRAKHEQINGLRQQLSQLQFEQTLAIRQILSPDQRQKLTELISRRRPRRK